MSDEAEQTTILIRSLQEAGAWARKYPDLQRLLAGVRAFGAMRSLPPQPCDIEACYLGRGLHIEVKYMDGYRSLNRSVFGRTNGPSQLDDLRRYEDAGGIGVVALVVWQARQYSRLLLWRVGELEEAMGEKGSVRAKDLRDLRGLEQQGSGRERAWNLGPWLDAVTAGDALDLPSPADMSRDRAELGITAWPCPFCAMTDHPTLTAPEFSDTDDQKCDECRGTLRVGYDTRHGYPGWTDEAIAWLREYEAVREADEVLP